MEESQVVESSRPLKIRAAGFRKIAEGHKLLGHAVEIGRLMTEQVATKHFEGHKLIAQGYEMLARADELTLEASSNVAGGTT